MEFVVQGLRSPWNFSGFLSPLRVKLVIQPLRITRNSLGPSCPLSAVSLHTLSHLTGIVFPSWFLLWNPALFEHLAHSWSFSFQFFLSPHVMLHLFDSSMSWIYPFEFTLLKRWHCIVIIGTFLHFSSRLWAPLGMETGNLSPAYNQNLAWHLEK